MIPKPRFLNRYRWYYQTAQAAVVVAALAASWWIAGGATTGPAAFDQIVQFERPIQSVMLTFFGMIVLAFLVEQEARSTERDHANAWAYNALPTLVPYPDGQDGLPTLLTDGLDIDLDEGLAKILNQNGPGRQ